MREIKFRAWDEVNKRMVEVKEIRFRDSRSTPYELRDESGDVVGQWLIDKPDLMQYTGLKDKNGKEIYEGDIVELNVEIHKVPKELNRHVVVFRKGAFVCSENGFYFWDYAEGVNDDTVEVIGNIYENPELLEK